MSSTFSDRVEAFFVWANTPGSAIVALAAILGAVTLGQWVLGSIPGGEVLTRLGLVAVVWSLGVLLRRLQPAAQPDSPVRR